MPPCQASLDLGGTDDGPAASLTDDMLTKEKLKFNPALERQARRWIEAVLGEELPADQTLMQALRTGAVLCRVAQRLLPNQTIKINERNQAYNHRVRKTTAGSAARVVARAR